MNKCIINYNAATTIGGQIKNQDVFLADKFISSPDVTEDQNYVGKYVAENNLCVFAVCDGIGMHEESGRAAEAALKEVKKKCEEFNSEEKEITIDSIKEWVEKALFSAREKMMEFCKENNIRGSSTIVLLAIANNFYVMANIGDSPAFIIENDEIKELSVRHNMATFKKMIGVNPAEGEDCILLHHLGDNELTFEEKASTIGKNVVFFICTDGVSNAFDDKEMFEYLHEEKMSDFFVSYAGKAPNSDNCTAITICVSIE